VITLRADLPAESKVRTTYIMGKNLYKAYTESRILEESFRREIALVNLDVARPNFFQRVIDTVNTYFEGAELLSTKYRGAALGSAKFLEQVSTRGLGTFPLLLEAGVHEVRFNRANMDPSRPKAGFGEDDDDKGCGADDPWYNLLDNRASFHLSCITAFGEEIKSLVPEGVPCDLIAQYILTAEVKPLKPGLYTGLMIARSNDYRFVPALPAAISGPYHEGTDLSGLARGDRTCIRFDGENYSRTRSPLCGYFISVQDEEDLSELLSEVFLLAPGPVPGNLVLTHRRGEAVVDQGSLDRFKALAQMTSLLFLDYPGRGGPI
jgi:hypothetical protein